MATPRRLRRPRDEVHYDRAVEPAASFQEYGVEDARISKVDGRWYMTTCSVSAERHCTTLYTSEDGLDYSLRGIVLDHQNKDMVLFEGKVGGAFVALTRPLGEVYFAYPEASPFVAGPAIHLAASPDAPTGSLSTNQAFARASVRARA